MSLSLKQKSALEEPTQQTRKHHKKYLWNRNRLVYAMMLAQGKKKAVLSKETSTARTEETKARL